jgi:hypothetical protein
MIPGLPNTLSAIADFLEWQRRFAGVEGPSPTWKATL